MRRPILGQAHFWIGLLLLVAVLLPTPTTGLRSPSATPFLEYQNTTGYRNNDQNPSWGTSGQIFSRRQMGSSYNVTQNGTQTYFSRGSLNATSSSARQISNLVFGVTKRLTSRYQNLLLPYFAELVYIDIVSISQNESENAYIQVPAGDIWKGAEDPSTPSFISYNRTSSKIVSNKREQVNEATSWLDMSWLYSADAAMLANQRSLAPGKGQICTSCFQDAPIKRVAQPGPWILAGDMRINENPVLHALFDLFANYHNSIARTYAAQQPTWSDETVFQESRAWNIAVYQKIVSREFLASFCGRALPPFINTTGAVSYNASLDPGVDNFFAFAVLPVFSAMKVSSLPRLNDRLEPIPEGPLLVRDTIDNPTSYYVENSISGVWNESGVMKSAAHSALLRGVSNTAAGRAEPSMIDDLRNLLFNPTNSRVASDLASVLIQRGRDHGLPSYNDARAMLKLPRIGSWTALTGDVALRRRLMSVYSHVDLCDPLVCGLAENITSSGSVSAIFRASILEQFTRTRDADRFWYEMPGRFSEAEIEEIHGITFSDLITQVYPDAVDPNSLPRSSFFLRQSQIEFASASSCVYDPLPAGFVSPNVIQLSPLLQLSWRVDFQREEITFIIQACVQGWVGIGFGAEPNTMTGADIILCRFLTDSGTSECTDRFAVDVGTPQLDTSIGGTNDILFTNGSISPSGTRRFLVVRKFDSKDTVGDKILSRNMTNLIFAYNSDTVALSYHGPSRSGLQKIRIIPEVITSSTTGLLTLASVFSSIGMIVSLVLIGFVLLNKEQFRYHSPVFCCIILIGTILGHTSVWTFLPTISDATCVINVWLINLSFVMVFSCLSLKTWRNWRVASNTKLKKLKIVSLPDLMKMFALLGSLELALLIIWTIFDRPQALIVQDSSSFRSSELLSSYHLVCKSPLGIFWYLSIAIKLALLSACSFVTFKTRHLPAIFNDSRQIAVGIFVATFSLLILIVVSVVLEWSVEATFVTRTIGASIPYTAICFVLFGNTTLRILQGKPPVNFSSQDKVSTGKAKKKKKTAAAEQSVKSGPVESQWRTEASVMRQNNMPSVVAEAGSPRLSFTEDVPVATWNQQTPRRSAVSSSSDEFSSVEDNDSDE